MVEGVVVEGELRALVVEVNFFIAVELAAVLVGDFAAGHAGPEVVDLVLESVDLSSRGFALVLVEDDLGATASDDGVPVPEGVVLTITLRH